MKKTLRNIVAGIVIPVSAFLNVKCNSQYTPTGLGAETENQVYSYVDNLSRQNPEGFEKEISYGITVHYDDTLRINPPKGEGRCVLLAINDFVMAGYFDFRKIENLPEGERTKFEHSRGVDYKLFFHEIENNTEIYGFTDFPYFIEYFKDEKGNWKRIFLNVKDMEIDYIGDMRGLPYISKTQVSEQASRKYKELADRLRERFVVGSTEEN